MRSFCPVVLLTTLASVSCSSLLPFWQPHTPSRAEELDELVRTIDYNADPLHGDYTPSVWKLIEIGDPAIPRMLDLMLLEGRGAEMTRQHAERVLWGIVMRKNGFESGRGWADPNGADRAGAFWESLGDLDHEAPLAERERAVKLWREWLAKKTP